MRALFLQASYHRIATVYDAMVRELLREHPSIASPGLLLVGVNCGANTKLLFDLLFFEKVLAACEPDESGIAEDLRVVAALKEAVLEEIDPVDWTLAESYMQLVLEEFVSSIALLISLLLADAYKLKNASASKSLSKNANVIFTPIEKLPSYPISSPSIQLLLQSRMKEKDSAWSVCLSDSRSKSRFHLSFCLQTPVNACYSCVHLFIVTAVIAFVENHNLAVFWLTQFNHSFQRVVF